MDHRNLSGTAEALYGFRLKELSLGRKPFFRSMDSRKEQLIMQHYRPETLCVQGATPPATVNPARSPLSSPPPSSMPPLRTWASSSTWRPTDISTPGSRIPPATTWRPRSPRWRRHRRHADLLRQAANFFALFNIATCGDHIVSSSSIYGGTFNLIAVTMAKRASR